MSPVGPPALPPSDPTPAPAQAAVRLLLFGAPTLVHGGRSEALPFERRSQLLVLLACKGLAQGPAGEGGWVGRSELASLLWPDQDHKLAYTNLRKTIHRLHLLPWGAQIQAQGGALRFAGSTDLRDFEAAIAQRHLPEALALRRGELLAGFDDDANEAWSAWLGFERERQRVAWRAAALGHLDSALPGADTLSLAAQLLEADPLDEAALGHQLQALARSGQVAAARQAYGRFVARLADELGIEPGAPLRALHDGLGLPAGVPAPAAVPLPATAAPVIDEGFIGRSAELRRIASLLEQPECRLLVLVGPGGIGKTRLARRALQELAPGFADGGAFVSLEDATTASALGERLTHAVVGQASLGGADALAEATAALRGRHMLLVLDNFETLAAHAAQLTPLLQACPQLKLLVTSRARLTLADEWTLALDGLPWPDAEDLDRLDAFDAVRLFVRTAQRVLPGFSPAAEAAAIVEICRLVEGLPLALELAAAWVRMLTCADIARELRSGSELLRAEDPARPARHASLEQVFEQSWSRLAAAERETLAGLSLFRGGFTASAARAVLGAPLAVLASLADKSLLHKDEGRLRLHPLVQQLAAARLHDTGRPAQGRPGAPVAPAAAHAAYYLQLLARSERALAIGAREALQLLDAESENCRAAWQWAACAGVAADSDTQAGRSQARLLGQAARALMHHADHRGRRLEGLKIGLWATGSPAALRHPPLRAVLLAACAHLAYRLGRHDEALSMAHQALQQAPPADDPARDVDARLQALRVVGGVHLNMGRLDAAREAYQEILALADAASNPMTRAGVLGNLSLVEKRAGRFDEAYHQGTEALQAYRRLGAVADEALCLNNLGDLQCIRGEYDSAEACLRESLRLCEQHGIVWTQAMALANLALLALLRNDVAAGRRAAERALPLIAQLGDRSTETTVRQTLAALALAAGELDLARRELDNATRTALALRQPMQQLLGVVVFGQLLAAQGEPEAARAVFDFVIADPQANAPVQAEARRQRALLAARAQPPVPALRWPDGLDLAQLTTRIVSEMPQAHAPLLAALRRDAAR